MLLEIITPAKHRVLYEIAGKKNSPGLFDFYDE
jgi:hypothetical protein